MPLRHLTRCARLLVKSRGRRAARTRRDFGGRGDWEGTP